MIRPTLKLFYATCLKKLIWFSNSNEQGYEMASLPSYHSGVATMSANKDDLGPSAPLVLEVRDTATV